MHIIFAVLITKKDDIKNILELFSEFQIVFEIQDYHCSGKYIYMTFCIFHYLRYAINVFISRKSDTSIY